MILNITFLVSVWISINYNYSYLLHIPCPELFIFCFNIPERVFGLQVRYRELDIFKIRNFFEKFFGNFLEFFGIFWGNFLDCFWRNFLERIFWENFFRRISWGEDFFWEELFVYIAC